METKKDFVWCIVTYKCKVYLFHGPNGLFVPPYFFCTSYLKTHMIHDCEFIRCIFKDIITPQMRSVTLHVEMKLYIQYSCENEKGISIISMRFMVTLFVL